MPRQRTEIVQPAGIIKDLSPFELPPNVWTDGLNVNFRRGRTTTDVGNSNPYPSLVLAGNPTYVQFARVGNDNYWLYCSDTVSDSRISRTNGVTSTVLTGGTGFTATRKVRWTGCDFNSLIIMNNAADHPQMMASPYTTAAPLANWNVPDIGSPDVDIWGSASRCEVMRAYKNYLIALNNYDENGKHYSNMVRWSGPAQLGEPPSSWNPNIVGEQAGLYALADTPGPILDGLTLGDYFVIYKSDAVWLMQFIGGSFTMSFRKLFGRDSGILAKECVAEFDGKHFVLAPQTCYVHNGATKEDVMDGWVKDEFFNNVAPDYIDETKVIADHNHNEIWVYYISKDAIGEEPYADRALVWNWVEGQWTIKTLNNISYIADGYVTPVEFVSDSWNTDSGSWNTDETRWNGELFFNPVLESLLLAQYNTKKFFGLEYTEGSDIEQSWKFVQRIGIDFNNDRRFKYVTRVVPHIRSVEPVYIVIYTSDEPTTVPNVGAQGYFDPNTEVDFDCHCTGRYIGIMFFSTGVFTVDGYTIEWEPTGDF